MMPPNLLPFTYRWHYYTQAPTLLSLPLRRDGFSSRPRCWGSPSLPSSPSVRSRAATPQGGSLPSLGLEAKRAREKCARMRNNKDSNGCVAKTVTQQHKTKGGRKKRVGEPWSPSFQQAEVQGPFAWGMLTPAGRVRERSLAAAGP